jgi:xylulokinase
MRFLIGVDIGTQGSKGALITETGEVVTTASVEATVNVPQPGWAEHEPDSAWWASFVDIVRQLLFKSQVDPRDIAAVNVSSLMPVLAPVDETGVPLRAALLYADMRAHEELAHMNSDLGVPGDHEFTGQLSAQLTMQDLGPKIYWFQRHEPERWRRTRYLMGAQGFVNAKLTGRYVVDRNTAIGYRPFFDPATGSYDPIVSSRFGVPIEMLPELVDMTDVVGEVTPAASLATGLAVGTPVVAGVIDFFAEMISTGADTPGDVVVTYGTTMCMAGLSDRPIGPCPGLGHMLGEEKSLAGLYKGLYSVGGGMVTSAALSRWFRDKFGDVERRVEQELGISAYGLLGLEADAVPPGSNGLIVLPYFSGERSPIHDDLARGMIFGLTLAHDRPHIYRALLEGVAYGVEHHFDLMRQSGMTLNRIVATGGGSRSHLWTQIISDVTGIPQVVVAPSNAALGAAFLAGKAIGVFSGLSDVRLWAKPEREVIPRENVHDVYQEYYRIYRRLYERTKDEMHDLARLTAAAAKSSIRPLGAELTVRELTA